MKADKPDRYRRKRSADRAPPFSPAVLDGLLVRAPDLGRALVKLAELVPI